MLTLILLAIICITVLVNFQFIRPAFYWRVKGVFYVSAWQRTISAIFGGTSFADATRSLYESHPDKRFIGSYQLLRPSLFIRDLELIKRITIKDFEHFTDHMTTVRDTNKSVILNNLFSLRGKQWHEMRTTISPTFTSKKMRQMFTLICNSAQVFVAHFNEVIQLNSADFIQLEINEMFSRYTNDVIASCAFGVTIDSLRDPENEFMRMGKKLFKNSRMELFSRMFPRLAQLVGMPVFDVEVEKFFRDLIQESINVRKRQSSSDIRPDIIHLLLEARKGSRQTDHFDKHAEETGYATAQETLSSITETTSSGRLLAITDDVITAQALVFFIAGFSTASSLMAFMAYELAINVDVQKRLQLEIDDYHAKHDELCYDELMKLKYLDQVVCETLRKWPPVFAMSRTCTKAYHIAKIEGNSEEPNEGIRLERGSLVTIPIFGLHRDPQFFPDPDRFDPDRFSDANKHSIIAGSYMPFSAGPRNCVASRFALLEIKTLMASLLRQFEFECCSKTRVVLSKAITIQAKDGIWLNMRARRSTAHYRSF